MLIPAILTLGVTTVGAALWRGRRRRFRPALVWTDEGVQYKCASCDKWHVGIPDWMFPGPDQAIAMTRRERARRVFREHDGLVLDGKWFYTLALLELRVHGVADRFAWGVWVALRSDDVERFVALYNDKHRTGGEVFDGRLGNTLPGYPGTFKLPVRLCVRPWPTRPFVEVVDSSHPLACDQQMGMERDELRRALTPLFA